MAVVVAYAPRPEGEAALEKGIEIAEERNEKLFVVNAGPGGHEKPDPGMADSLQIERVENRLAKLKIPAELKQFIRGKSIVEELDDLIIRERVTLVVIGLRHRTLVGKLLLGSTAESILLNVPCPVLAVKPVQSGH